MRWPTPPREDDAPAASPGGRPAGLARRIWLTYRYHGLGTVIYRLATFPLRFTPLEPCLRLENTGRLTTATARRWYRHEGRPVTVVIPSYRDLQHVRRLVRSIRRTTRPLWGLLAPPHPVMIVVADDASGPDHVEGLQRLPGVRVVVGEENAGFATNANRAIASAPDGADVVVLNSDVVARPGWLAALQYAAYRGKDVGIVGAKLLYPDRRIQFAGTVRNRDAPEWFDHRFRFAEAGYGPANVGGSVLAVTGACMYIKRETLRRIGAFAEEYPMAYEDVDLCLRAWHGGLRTVYCPEAELLHLESVTRGTEVNERVRRSQQIFWERWGEFFDARQVRTADGTLRIIYVTQDTGVGGGHRDIFEHLNGLLDRGHEAELWTLTDGPTWFELRAPVRTFPDYPSLTRALAPIDAIKVATWWETADPVWRASILHGIPVYFVQDIETSYYPDSEVVRHLVLASYRHEFRYMTISSWNNDRLRELGLDAALIPPGIDLANFQPLPNAERQQDMILALGRSNPLKNLPLTLKAWRALPAPRPELCLFGVEPQTAPAEPGVRYVTSPSDAEVNQLLNEATLFLQTSSHEGFCLPVLEAMAAGCPAICTDAHGNRDYCNDGVNCLMPEAEAGAVAQAITRLLRAPNLREQLAQHGLSTAATYGWEKRLSDLERFYEQVATPGHTEPSTDAVPELRKAPVD